MAIITLYPYADGADASIFSSSNSSWATARNAASGTVRTNYVQSTLSGATRFIERSFFTFDTSSIPDNASIASATFSIHITAITNNNSPSYRLYDSSNTDLIAPGDYSSMGTTELSNTYLVSPTTGAYADYPLNAAGILAISKTGKTKYCIREAVYDLGNVQPGGSNVLEYKDSSVVGTSTDPMLVITYTDPGAGFFANFI